MKTLFKINYINNQRGDILNEINDGADWVINGEGIPTQKFDGTACAVIDGKYYVRFDAKSNRTIPNGFIPAQDPDAITDHYPGWVPIEGHSLEKIFYQAATSYIGDLVDGTYELCGPKVNGNQERINDHILIKHGSVILDIPYPITLENIREYFKDKDMEGIVWHHKSNDGRMVKLRLKDYGLQRNYD